MAKRSRKQERREAKAVEIEQKEYEDAHGIKRKVKYGYSDGMSLKTIRIIKIVLLVAGLVSFFLYSVLLLPIVLLYGLLYFFMRQKERNMNYGMRKELWVKLPKFDCTIALIIVIVTFCMVGLSAISTRNRNSVFAGKNEAQVYQILVTRGTSSGDAEERAKDMVKNGMTLTTWERYMYQAGSLLTGHRELFQSKYQSASSFGRMVVRKPSDGMPSSGSGGGVMKIKRPDGSVQTSSGRPPNFARGAGFGMNPMMMASITQVLTTSNMILLLIMVAGGGFIVLRKKQEKEDDRKEVKAKSIEPVESVEAMKIKTIKQYTDIRTGQLYMVDDIRTVTQERGNEICSKGYAVEFISKAEKYKSKK